MKRLELIQKQDSIDSIFSISRQQKTKRFVGVGLASIVTAGFQAVNAYLQYRKTAAITKSLYVIGNNLNSLNNRFIDFKQEMVSITGIQFNEIKKNAKNIKVVNKNMIGLKQWAEHNFRHIDHNITVLERRTRTLRITTYVLSNMIVYLDKMINMFDDMIQHCDLIINSASMLLQGRLPHTLINPEKLTEILDHSAMVLYQTHPNYMFTFDKVQQYYSMNNVESVMDKDILVIQLAIPIKPKSQKGLTLYQVESIYVPVNMSMESSTDASYTKLEIDSEYIAVEGNNFIELNNQKLQSCQSFDNTWVCEDILLQSQSKSSCLMSIFQNADINIIKQLCSFKYIHELKVPPAILSDGYYLVLAGIGLPWYLDCENDNLPLRMKGHKFGIVERSLLCHCSITTPVHFVAPVISNCNRTAQLPKVNIKYTINGAMVAFFNESLNTKEFTKVSQLSEKIPQAHVPAININHIEMDDIVSDSQSDQIDLKKLAKLVQTGNNLYYNKEDKLQANSNFDSWFKENNFEIGITFIFSIFGTLSLILTILLCLKSHKLTTLVGAFMTVPQAEARSPLPEGCILHNSSTVISTILIQLSITVCVFAFVKLVIHLLRKYDAFKIIVPLGIMNIQSSCETKIFLEINSAQDKLLVYVCTIKARLVDITTNNMINMSNVSIRHANLYDILEIDWDSSSFSIFHTDILFKIPSLIYVPFYKAYKLRNLLKCECVFRVLMGDQIYQEIYKGAHAIIAVQNNYD